MQRQLIRNRLTEEEDPMNKKLCTACNKQKLIKNFNKRKASLDGLSNYCKKCSRLKNKNFRTENPEKEKARMRKSGTRFIMSVSRAKKRGIEWALDLDQWTSLVVGKMCHYCDGTLPETNVALDRKNNNIGYLFDNVVPCCRECNRLKSDIISYIEMLAISKLLKEMRSCP